MAMAPEKSDSVPNVPGGRSWSSIAALNTSKRNKTNTIEVRLENEENTGCSLNIEEIERLVRRLKIKSSDLVSLQACPERRNVVFITLREGVDANKFTQFANESFVLKEGVRTTTIKQASSREVHVKVFGLHPDTKDEAVVRQSVPCPNVVRLWAMVLLIGGERGKDLMRSKNGRLRCGEFVSIVSWSM